MLCYICHFHHTHIQQINQTSQLTQRQTLKKISEDKMQNSINMNLYNTNFDMCFHHEKNTYFDRNCVCDDSYLFSQKKIKRMRKTCFFKYSLILLVSSFLSLGSFILLTLVVLKKKRQILCKKYVFHFYVLEKSFGTGLYANT